MLPAESSRMLNPTVERQHEGEFVSLIIQNYCIFFAGPTSVRSEVTYVRIISCRLPRNGTTSHYTEDEMLLCRRMPFQEMSKVLLLTVMPRQVPQCDLVYGLKHNKWQVNALGCNNNLERYILGTKNWSLIPLKARKFLFNDLIKRCIYPFESIATSNCHAVWKSKDFNSNQWNLSDCANRQRCWGMN